MNFEQVKISAELLKSKGFEKPVVGIVLGTGLPALAKEIEDPIEISYTQIPGFVASTVESHSGKLIYGTIADVSVVAMAGRFHFYEGYSMEEVTFPIRVLKQLGIKFLLLSNACGGLNPDFSKGELMLLTDHINLLPTNPLIGKNEDEMGTRFPDMSMPYDVRLNSLILNCAQQLNIILHAGVYVSVPGPNLETRAEYRYLRRIGADVVGMSTVPEVIVANHMKLPCAAVSVITDECDPDNLHAVSIEDIIAVAAQAEVNLVKLFKEAVKNFTGHFVQ